MDSSVKSPRAMRAKTMDFDIIDDIQRIEGVKVNSFQSYFDMFTTISTKPEIHIPDTVLVNDYEIKGWLFNKKSE